MAAALSPAFWRTWLPVFVAMLSAALAGFSAWLAWRNQVFGFAKDIAAVRRDARSKQATIALLAFENSVARPVGQALDLIERLLADLGKLNEEPTDSRTAALERYSRTMFADYGRCQRFCLEADDVLQQARPGVFVRAYSSARLDDRFLAAAAGQLSGQAGSAYDDAADAVVSAKVQLRRALEDQRAAEAATWQNTSAEDAFLREAERLLPRWLRSRGRP